MTIRKENFDKRSYLQSQGKEGKEWQTASSTTTTAQDKNKKGVKYWRRRRMNTNKIFVEADMQCVSRAVWDVSSLHPCWLEVWLLSHTTFSLHSVWYDGILFCYIKQLDETPPDPNHVVILTHSLHSTSLLTVPYWTNHRWQVERRFAESSHKQINSQKLNCTSPSPQALYF